MSCPHVANVLRVPTQILQKNIEIIGLLAKCNQHNFLMIYGIFCWKEHTSPKILLVYLFTVSVTKGKIAKADPGKPEGKNVAASDGGCINKGTSTKFKN